MKLNQELLTGILLAHQGGSKIYAPLKVQHTEKQFLYSACSADNDAVTTYADVSKFIHGILCARSDLVQKHF